jgi:hypothetical protein
MKTDANMLRMRMHLQGWECTQLGVHGTRTAAVLDDAWLMLL